MARIAFALDHVQLLDLVRLELGMLEDLVAAPLALSFVEVVHVELPDERGEIVVFEVLG